MMKTQPESGFWGLAGGSGISALQKTFDLCVSKTRNNIGRLADSPTTWAHDPDGFYPRWKEDFFEIGNWTTSFFTGMALLAWRETEDEYFLKQVLRLAPYYRKKVFERHLETHHDLGFLYSLYSVALYKLTSDREHRDVGIRAAEVLSHRFNPVGNFIRAWGQINTDEHEDVAIVDCLMNLPLLYWASQETGIKKYHDIAVLHADMCLKYFIRTDGSVNHAFRFDLKTGRPVGPENFCGFSTDSYWARGATWAIYGFALSYGYTNCRRYLDASMALAEKFIAELDGEAVPVWDFRLPADEPRVRDASAAAVMVCGLQELQKHNAADRLMMRTKARLLEKLCSDEYVDSDLSRNGILKNGYGRKPAFASWGDYFLMEAISRELGQGPSWW